MTTAIQIIERYNRKMPCAAPQESVLHAAKLMDEYKVGALLVREKTRCVGIFTEHDLLRRVIAKNLNPTETAIVEVMSKNLIVCPPEMDAGEARRVMAYAHCHNLPVVNADGDLEGLVTLSDLNAFEYEAQENEIDYLKRYFYERS